MNARTSFFFAEVGNTTMLFNNKKKGACTYFVAMCESRLWKERGCCKLTTEHHRLFFFFKTYLSQIQISSSHQSNSSRLAESCTLSRPNASLISVVMCVCVLYELFTLD
uniref:Uncharacterized protein n=1 Tax=Rhipicephalus appendiculatus TaxID=34631 RepID=A0A131YA52_RHIAP